MSDESELDEMKNFEKEEQNAFTAPLKSREMEKMEVDGEALHREIDAGLKGIHDAASYKKSQEQAEA